MAEEKWTAHFPDGSTKVGLENREKAEESLKKTGGTAKEVGGKWRTTTVPPPEK